MKKFGIALVTAALCGTMAFSFAACGPEGGEEEGDNNASIFETMYLTDGTIAITGFEEVYAPENHELVIPATIEGRTVTQVNLAKGYDSSTQTDIVCEGITKVVLPDTVRYIGGFYEGGMANDYYTFDGVPNMTDINIPENIVDISPYAFKGLNLNYNKLGEDSYLGNDANPYLVLMWIGHTGPALSGDVEKSTLEYSIDARTRVIGPNVLWEHGDTGGEHMALNKIDLSNVTTVCNEAFSGLYRNDFSLTDIGDTTKLKHIGAQAFYRCNRLTNIEFGSDLETLGDSAFGDCSGLTEVTFAENTKLKSIGGNCFRMCPLSGALTIPAGVETIGREAFYASRFEQLSFAAGSKLKTIGERAFQSNSVLENVVLPDGVESIGDDAFNGDTNLLNINIPASVTYIGKGAFDENNRTGRLMATFADVNGWAVSTKEDAKRSEMTAVQLSGDPNNGAAANGTLLQRTHADKYWRKG